MQRGIGLVIFAVVAAIVFFILAMGADAQTVGPTAMEFKGPKAHGTIMVRNDGASILAVTVGPQGFGWRNGAPELEQLDPRVEFHSKQAALTLGPLQTKFVDFDLQCPEVTCHVYVTAVFTTPKAANGLNTALHLPVATYLCEENKNCRRNTLRAAGAIK